MRMDDGSTAVEEARRSEAEKVRGSSRRQTARFYFNFLGCKCCESQRRNASQGREERLVEMKGRVEAGQGKRRMASEKN